MTEHDDQREADYVEHLTDDEFTEARRGAPATFDFEIKPEDDSGVTFAPWTDGWAVGFKCTHKDGRVVYIYLNPSGGSDDDVATVFPYAGTNGNPAIDMAACDHHFPVDFDYLYEVNYPDAHNERTGDH